MQLYVKVTVIVARETSVPLGCATSCCVQDLTCKVS
jgi:hypothetical protein